MTCTTAWTTCDGGVPRSSSRRRRVDGVSMRAAGRVDGVESAGYHTGQGAHPGTRGRRLVGRRVRARFMFVGPPGTGKTSIEVASPKRSGGSSTAQRGCLGDVAETGPPPDLWAMPAPIRA